MLHNAYLFKRKLYQAYTFSRNNDILFYMQIYSLGSHNKMRNMLRTPNNALRLICKCLFLAKGRYVGASCDFTCHATLLHVYCDPITSTCGCEKSYPVVIGLKKGCAKREYLYWFHYCNYFLTKSQCIQHNQPYVPSQINM